MLDTVVGQQSRSSELGAWLNFHSSKCANFKQALGWISKAGADAVRVSKPFWVSLAGARFPSATVQRWDILHDENRVKIPH